jgi:hypothetical protein
MGKKKSWNGSGSNLQNQAGDPLERRHEQQPLKLVEKTCIEAGCRDLPEMVEPVALPYVFK